MPGTLISVRVNPTLLAQAEALRKRRGYSSVQELVREQIRLAVAHDELRAIIGSQPRSKRLTTADREAVQREFFAERGWDYDAFRREHAKNLRKTRGQQA